MYHFQNCWSTVWEITGNHPSNQRPFRIYAYCKCGKTKRSDQSNTVFSSDRITIPLPDAHVRLSALSCLCDPYLPRKTTHSIFDTCDSSCCVFLGSYIVENIIWVFPEIRERTDCDCGVLCMISIFPNKLIQV